jgi:hypothetical protein
MKSDSWGFIMLVTGGLALDFLPTIIGIIRKVECLALVIILNMLPVAWPAAMILACFMPPRDGW